MTFGEKIRQLRIDRGLTQKELATLIGKNSTTYISKIELGQRSTTVPMVKKLASVLGVSISELMMNTDIGNDNKNRLLEYLPYLAKADETTLIAVRKLLDMPPLQEKKTCMEVC